MHPHSTPFTASRTPVRHRLSKKLDLSCPQCGQSFASYRYDVEQRRRTYCSAGCQAKAQRMAIPPRDELVALYEQGVSTNGLAFHYKVSKGTIYNWLKGYGVITRSVGEGVTLAQRGTVHTAEWNEAIGRGHRARGSWQGRDNPNLKYAESSKPRSKGGKRATLGGLYVRSRWEHNYALYLNLLVQQGDILRWEYEPDTFEFHEVKRGNRYYTPDFKVFQTDGSVSYHEVKGYMDAASKTKLERMARYYPHVEITLIDADAYKAIKKWRGLLPGWE